MTSNLASDEIAQHGLQLRREAIDSILKGIIHAYMYMYLSCDYHVTVSMHSGTNHCKMFFSCCGNIKLTLRKFMIFTFFDANFLVCLCDTINTIDLRLISKIPIF